MGSLIGLECDSMEEGEGSWEGVDETENALLLSAFNPYPSTLAKGRQVGGAVKQFVGFIQQLLLCAPATVEELHAKLQRICIMPR